LAHVQTDRLDAPGDVVAEQRILRSAEAETRETHDVRHPGHQVPDALIDPRCLHAHQHLTLACDRLVDLRESQNLDGAVGVPHHRLHVCCSICAHLGFE
jgi:hypothetical protein